MNNLQSIAAPIRSDSKLSTLALKEEKVDLETTFANIEQYIQAQQWRTVIETCHDGLSDHPFAAGLWMWKGRAHRELKQWGHAEISYRTACAYGYSRNSLAASLGDVMRHQGVPDGRFPLSEARTGRAGDSAPGAPDINLLAQMTWQVRELHHTDMLDLLRNCDTIDKVLDVLISDQRFEKANRAWLLLVRDGDI